MSIAGILWFDGGRSMAGHAARMSEALVAYGVHDHGVTPDGAFGFVSPPVDTGRHLPSGARAVVADARIDNRRDVLDALRLDEADGLSDQELIAHAFDAWGTGLSAHVVGAFTVGVFDSRDRRVHCIRDHLGQRPLFYCHTPEFFAFASMPTALYALDEIPCVLDEVKMAGLLVGYHGDVASSPFQNIFRLPGGCALTANAGHVRVSRYWDASEAPRVSLPSNSDYAEAAGTLFRQTTRSLIRSTRPVGLMLSGGLDSAGAACVAAGELAKEGRRLMAFHRHPPDGLRRSAPPGKVLDERRYVEAIARRYGNVDVTWVADSPRSPLEGLAARMRACQRPVLRAANHNWFHPLWQAAGAHDVGVMLGGGAGGLTLGWGGQRELAALARSGDWGAVRRLVPERARWLGTSSLSVLIHHVVRPLVSESLRRMPGPGASGRDLQWLAAGAPINPAIGEELRLGERLRDAGWVGDERRDSPRALRVRQARYYEDVVGEIHAGVGSLYGFELRDPYRDRRLADFCFGVPVEQYLADGPDRSLMRRAFKDVVPDDILARRDKGSQASDWAERLLGATDELTAEVDLIARSPLASHLLDVGRLRALLESDRLRTWVHRARAGAAPADAELAVMADYSGVLLQGVTAGLFIRWVEAGCRSDV